MDELALSTLVAGVAVSGVGEDDGLLPVSACYFSFIIFLCYCFCFITQNALSVGVCAAAAKTFSL